MCEPTYNPLSDDFSFYFEGDLMQYLQELPAEIKTIPALIKYLENQAHEDKQEYISEMQHLSELRRDYPHY